MGKAVVRDVVEKNAGGNPLRQCGFIGVYDRVAQTPSPCRHRNAAIGQPVELRQAARFEARWDQDGVSSALEQMREFFVITNGDRDLAGMTGGRGAKFHLKGCVSRAEQSQPRAQRYQGINLIAQHIHALLQGQATDHRQQRSFVGVRPEAALDRALVDAARLDQAKTVASS